MNGNPFTANFIGSTGQYPIYDYIRTTSNVLHKEILATSNITSNICYAISSNVGLLFKSEFEYFMNKDDSNNILFNKQENTKIDDKGELFVFHQADVFLPTRPIGFWNVHSELSSLIGESTMARFDITNLQIETYEMKSLLGEHTATLVEHTATLNANV